MNNLQVIKVKGQRVLTTKQLAVAYETEEDKIRWNYKYNKEKYKEGKHYILIQGEELRKLKRECEFHTLFKQAKSVCFWTEKGALLHAKSLNTDKAWEVYDYLVDFYFRVKEVRQQASDVRQQGRGNQVIDIPVNERAQALMQELHNNLVAADTVLKLCNRYQPEEDYKKIVHTMQQLASRIGDTAFSMALLKPQVIEKYF